MTVNLTKAVDFTNKNIVKLLKKHPALVAGGVGLGVGATNLSTPAHQVENDIMREYLGDPNAVAVDRHIMN